MHIPPKIPFRRIETPNKLRINDIELAYVKSFNYLGITIDSNLNFSEHFDNIKQKCARRINILRCIAGKDWGADRTTLFQLYTSLIRPILDYNAFLFDNIASQKIDSLQIIQNNALRIITGAHRTTNVYNLHIEANIPTLERRRKLLLLRFYGRASSFPNSNTFRIISIQTNNAPQNMQDKFPLISKRIEHALEEFQITQLIISPAPPLTSFYLPEVTCVEFLFTNSKKQVTNVEVLQLFREYANKHQHFTFYYTDGSVANGRTAAAVVTPNHNRANRLHDYHSVYTAELAAIHTALREINKTNNKYNVICSDSAASLRAIQHKTYEKHNVVYRIKLLLAKQLQNNVQTKLLWIPGHTNIPGNEKADREAKNALNLPERNTVAVPYQDFLTLLTKQFYKIRQHDWDNVRHYYLYPIKPKICHFTTSKQDSRENERAIARLRLGHTELTHGYLMDREPTPECQHCPPHTRYTVEHFLIHCPRHAHHRRHIARYTATHNINTTLPVLLGDEHPELVKLVLKFLLDTRLIHNI